jgi:Gas vesicle protein
MTENGNGVSTILNGARPAGRRLTGASQGPANLADLLERVLDKGIVIAGDITLCLGEIELLQIKIRLLIASVDKAREMGIDWWQHDPALSSAAMKAADERGQLTERVDRLDSMLAALAKERETPVPQKRAAAEEHAAPCPA